MTTGYPLQLVIANVRRVANLTVTKTNMPCVNGNFDQVADTVPRRVDAHYSLVAANAGPDAADDAVLRDSPSSGLTIIRQLVRRRFHVPGVRKHRQTD